MSMHTIYRTVAAGALAAALVAPAPARAQPTAAVRPVVPADRPGIDLFAGVGANWPAARDSFDALDLDAPGFEFGGGGRVTGIWKKLFVQGTVHQWSDSGERAFVDEDGNVFPLGIPLDVDATYFDATIGWKDVVRNSSGRISFLSYVGAGAGVVRYKERSPFAAEGDDLDTTEASYNFLAGVEVPLGRIFAVAIDGRYRLVPGLLGDDGVSSVLDEDFLGGFQVSVGVRVGFGGPRYIVPPVKPADTGAGAGPPPPSPRVDGGVMLASAPVFLLPDATRTPLRTLPAGTTIRILEEKGDWVRIEFRDNQYGARVGYVQRKFVQSRQQEN